MKNINDLVANRASKPVEKTKARCRRDELVDAFLAKLNPDRVAAGYQPYTPGVVLGKIKRAGYQTDTDDLHTLYRQCESAHSFGKLFSYLMKNSVDSRSA